MARVLYSIKTFLNSLHLSFSCSILSLLLSFLRFFPSVILSIPFFHALSLFLPFTHSPFRLLQSYKLIREVCLAEVGIHKYQFSGRDGDRGEGRPQGGGRDGHRGGRDGSQTFVPNFQAASLQK